MYVAVAPSLPSQVQSSALRLAPISTLLNGPKSVPLVSWFLMTRYLSPDDKITRGGACMMTTGDCVMAQECSVIPIRNVGIGFDYEIPGTDTATHWVGDSQFAVSQQCQLDGRDGQLTLCVSARGHMLSWVEGAYVKLWVWILVIYFVVAAKPEVVIEIQAMHEIPKQTH